MKGVLTDYERLPKESNLKLGSNRIGWLTNRDIMGTMAAWAKPGPP